MSARPLVAELRADTSWHAQGACREEDDTLFYHPEGERGTARRRRAEIAKAVCRACPVMETCQADSLERREPYGTWGGISEDERHRVLAGHPLPAVRPSVATRARRLAPLIRTMPDVPHEMRGPSVSTKRVATHVQHLLDMGYGVAEIAEVADVLGETVRRIKAGASVASLRTVKLLLDTRPEAIEVAA